MENNYWQFPTLAALAAALAAARDDAKRQARRDWDFPFWRDRQRRLISCADQRTNQEPAEWGGTLKEVREYVAEAIKHGATGVYIEGGFDASDTFAFDDYQPEAGIYDVLVWSSRPSLRNYGIELIDGYVGDEMMALAEALPVDLAGRQMSRAAFALCCAKAWPGAFIYVGGNHVSVHPDGPQTARHYTFAATGKGNWD